MSAHIPFQLLYELQPIFHNLPFLGDQLDHCLEDTSGPSGLILEWFVRCPGILARSIDPNWMSNLVAVLTELLLVFESLGNLFGRLHRRLGRQHPGKDAPRHWWQANFPGKRSVLLYKNSLFLCLIHIMRLSN